MIFAATANLARRLRQAGLQGDELRLFTEELRSLVGADSGPFYVAVNAAKARLRGWLKRAPEQERLRVLLFAVKIANLFVARHEYHHGRGVLSARPIGFMIDPANGCQLGCATCCNTFNKEFAERTFNPFPRGIMKADLYSQIIGAVGPCAFVGHFYNNSEPFLNKLTPQFVKQANRLQVRTSISSNMSIPKLDVGAIVDSGLDELHLAIDGVSQKAYEKYRRGGNIELVFDNVRRLVAERERRGSPTPFIRWHYLTFEHNVHELEAAIELGRDLGIDFFLIVTPIDVSADDPEVRAVRHTRAGECIHYRPSAPGAMNSDLSEFGDIIESAFAECLTERNQRISERSYNDGGDRCDWLYLATIFDARGRVSPCCIGDIRNTGKLQFGSVKENVRDVLNSTEYKAARALLNGTPRPAAAEMLRCETCTGRPVPQCGLDAVADSLRKWSNFETWLSPELIQAMTGWSEHKVAPTFRDLAAADGNRPLM